MDEDPPQEPPKKGYFYGRRKRGRSLSRHRSSKVNQKSSGRPTSRSSGDEAPAASQVRGRDVPEHNEVADRIQSQGQRRKITKKELLSALKKTKKAVEEKQLLLAASQKKCSQLSTKNSSLVEGIRDARSQARSSKAAAAKAEEDVRASSNYFERSTHELQREVTQLQSTLATKEVEHQQAISAAMEKEVAVVKEKAQVRRLLCCLVRRRRSKIGRNRARRLPSSSIASGRCLDLAPARPLSNGLIRPLNPAVPF
jgi:chromosome segregation ATPase